jgi:predicted nucleotidyltransferase
MMEPQIEELHGRIRNVLGDDLIGAYLHGSAVLGGLKPRSDIDVIAVTTRPTTQDQKRRLAELLLELSGPPEPPGPPRPIEFDLVVASEIRPWRHPAKFDFHYSELWRKQFENGNVEPWSSRTNLDLASVITMTLVGGGTLSGPPPAEVFDPVPRRDYVDAVLRDTKTVDDYLSWDTRNVVLTLPRIWTAIATDSVHSKDSAAQWALARLPKEHRPVLARARAVYLGERDAESWDDVLPQVRAYADYVISEIERAKTASA